MAARLHCPSLSHTTSPGTFFNFSSQCLLTLCTAFLTEQKLTLILLFTSLFLPCCLFLLPLPILHILSSVTTTWETAFIHELLYLLTSFRTAATSGVSFQHLSPVGPTQRLASWLCFSFTGRDWVLI